MITKKEQDKIRRTGMKENKFEGYNNSKML